MNATAQTPQRRPLAFWRGVFYLLLAAGLVLTWIRFSEGLGAVTNLSDEFPWGLWVGFKLSCIGLAAGGFTITAIVYVFNIKRFEPIVRPTVLTAFLGYGMFVVALLYDLGRPWNIWHPLVMWNPRSVMFEVSWCVTLYTAVLAMEFSGLLWEKLGWTRVQAIQRMATLPLVIAGVILSTLHQSSLGALYLIVPGKLHPLWYSNNLPMIFYASALCAGFAMIIVESRLASKAFGRQLEVPLLREIGRILFALLCVFGVLRGFDLVQRGVLGMALDGGYEARMFQLELLLGLVPVAILAFPRYRRDMGSLYMASVMVVMAFVVNRLNVSVTGLEGAQGTHYVPAWSEVTLTLMLIASGFALFALAVRYLNVYPETGAGSAGGTLSPAGGAQASAAPAHPDHP